MSTPLNPLVEKVRAKYPGVYDDISDVDLTRKLLTKYPQYKDIAIPAPGPEPKPSVGEIAKSAAVGAFEGVGVKPATTPGAVVAGTFRQAAQGVGDLVSETFKANETPFNKGTPLQVAETALDLVPTFIDKTTTALEQGGRKAISAFRRKDYEEAAEQGASTLTSAAMLRGGKPVSEEAALSDVGKLRKSAAEKVQGFARKATGVETAVKESVGKAAEKQGEALTENAAKRTETVKGNLETQRAAESKIVRDKMAIGEKNKGIEAENAAQAADVARRGELAKTVDEQSNQLHGHIKNVEASVAKEANRKFDEVRAAVGNPEAPPDNLVATVKGVEHDVLQDIPENIKEFRAILKMEPLPDDLAEAVRKHAGFDPEGPEPLTWDKLQSLKSRIDARLRKSNGMNGDLKRALYKTQDAIVDEMGSMAEGAGAGDQWGEARSFWRQYKEDFHEPQGPSGSGSPVAQSLNAADPKNIRQPFLQKQATTGNRAVQILRKYPQHGGEEAASHAERLIQNHETMRGLPEKVSPKALKTYPEVHEMPASTPAPKIPENPTVDVNKVARERIAAAAKNWGQFNARDIGILSASAVGGVVEAMMRGGGYELPVAAVTYESGKFAASRMLNKPSVIEWLAKTPAEEIRVLNKIPGADRIKIADGLTQVAVSGGKPVQLSPAAKAFLGARNVARIMAVSTPSVVKTPGEAKDRARQLANK